MKSVAENRILALVISLLRIQFLLCEHGVRPSGCMVGVRPLGVRGRRVSVFSALRPGLSSKWARARHRVCVSQLLRCDSL